MELKYRLKEKSTGNYMERNFWEIVDWEDQPIVVPDGDIVAFSEKDNDFDVYGYDSDDYTVEVFTGLHDKHGNEIYEGDRIIFSKALYKMPLTVVYNSDYAQFEVLFKDQRGLHCYELRAFNAEFYEVIKEES